MTLWDAGEFLAAIHTVGIPHPPGTPLYILIGAAWSKVAGSALGFARSINLLSALATATGCAVLASCVSRWTASRLAGICAGIAAGTMLSVWRSANETEVYALSLLLAVVALAVADRAGVSGSWRTAALAVYVLALAVPLHISALVITPAVVLFAATGPDGRVSWSRTLLLGGAAGLVMALGTLSPALAGLSIAIVIAGIALQRDSSLSARVGYASALGALLLVAASAVSVLYFRAQFDPFVNQGNPDTIDGVLGVIGREQYDVPAVWPRRAPIWLQVGNLVQYADWQVAFGLDQWVGASLRRTPLTIVFVVLAFIGARWHRTRDPRSFRVMAVAIASATLGTVLVLNLRAGPSFGIGVLPADALHEARERDYFFALAFALCAAWAGVGASRVARRALQGRGIRGLAELAAVVIAAAPVALNWRAADRRNGGAATLAQQLATALLDSAPPQAVLFVAGDNDTYPLWYRQEVEGRRRDVTIVTIPLLPAEWYRLELRRRHGLLTETAAWRGLDATIESVAQHARQGKRPLVVAASVAARQREALGRDWLALGILYSRREADAALPGSAVSVRATRDSLFVAAADQGNLFIDTLAAARIAAPALRDSESDPTRAYVSALLSCPEQLVRAVRARSGSVDPRCNLR